MLDLKRIQGLTLLGLAQAAALLAVLAGIYASSHTVMVSWWDNDDYSYCYLLPAVIGWIVWQKLDRLRSLATRGGWGGLVPLGVGVLLYWLGEFGSEYYTQFLSSWLVVLALCWLFFGRAVLAELGFVFLLLFTMMPLPNFLNNRLTVQLQIMATQLAEVFIRLMGMSVYREGNVIDLGFLQLQVVEACSGLRYLFPLIVLGLVLTYFTRLRVWKKCLMVASAVPISLLLNALRIALTALLSKLLGPQVAEGFSHDFAGWAIFLVSFALLHGVGVLLGRLPGEAGAAPLGAPMDAPTEAPKETPKQEPVVLPVDTLADGSKRETEARTAQPPAAGLASGLALGRAPGLRFWVTLVVLCGTFFGITGQAGQEMPPKIRPFSEFPMQIAAWNGSPQYLSGEILDLLKPSQYLMVDYVGPEKAPVNLYVAYYLSQRKGQAIHSPESCLPGTGWSVEEEAVVPIIPQAGGAAQQVNRSLAGKGPARILTYFWFAQQGRKLTSLPALKLSTFYGAVTLHRTDGALVRLSTPLGPHEPAAQADERLLRFLRDVEPTLRLFVPD